MKNGRLTLMNAVISAFTALFVCGAVFTRLSGKTSFQDKTVFSSVSDWKYAALFLTVFAALFPPKETMRRRYAYAAKHGWLLPAAYAARIFRYLFSRSDTAETLSNAEARSDLMRQYGIF